MKKLQKGFTLIELMIVVAIIAILAAVAAPKFGVQMKKAKDAKGLAIVGSLRSAAQMKVADNHDTLAAGNISYADLKAAIDTKSQAFVAATADGKGGSVEVGANYTTAAGGTGVTAATATSGAGVINENHIGLDEITAGQEGLIQISVDNGFDAKGKDWSTY